MRTVATIPAGSAMATKFDAFISYRRSDGNVFARRLRRLLQDFRPPRPLQERQTRPLKVYLDTIYEQATNDFFERVTLPALLDSRHLIVVATKDAVDRGRTVTTGPARDRCLRAWPECR